MAKKIHTDDIDESFIIASIKQDRKPEPTKVADPLPEIKVEEPIPEASKKRKGKHEQYEELFFKDSSQSARLGKAMTIRPEFHDKITKIIQVIGGNQTSLFSYIDNVIIQHFEMYKQEINELYDSRDKKPEF